MSSFNKVILVGNLTQDVSMEYAPSGTAYAEVTIATNRRWKNKQDEWVDEAEFNRVKFMGRTAEIASEYLTKGSSVLIEGRLKTDSWEKDGKRHHKTYVFCENMQMLGGRGGRGGNQQSQQPTPVGAASGADDSIPF